MQATQPKPKGSSKGRWIALVVVLVVAVAAAGGWYFFLRPTPEQAVKGFLEASQRNDVPAIKSYLSAQSLKLVAQYPGNTSPMQMFAPGGGSYSPSYKIGQATITGDTATVPVRLPMPKGAMMGSAASSEFEAPFVVLREEGKWKVDLTETMGAIMGAAMTEMMKGMTTAPGGAPGMPGMGAPSAPPAPPK